MTTPPWAQTTVVAPSRHRWLWARRIAIAVATVAPIGALLWVVRVLDHPWYLNLLALVVLGTVIAGAVWTVQDHSRGLRTAQWYSTHLEEAAPPPGLDYRLVRLRRDLRDAVERSDRVDVVHAQLWALTAERLASLHDIDLQADPEAAAAVLHPELRRYLDHPPSGTARRSRKDLTRAIQRIEEL